MINKNTIARVCRQVIKESLEPNTQKVYKLRIHGTTTSGRDFDEIKEMTMEECRDYFSYTLEIGSSHDRTINPQPKTMRALINAINKSFAIKYGRCYRAWEEVDIVG